MSITYSEYVSVTLVIQRAMHMRRGMKWPVACLTLPYFSTLPHKRFDFPEKSLSINCVFLSSL
jgi:hypothetical protein